MLVQLLPRGWLGPRLELGGLFGDGGVWSAAVSGAITGRQTALARDGDRTARKGDLVSVQMHSMELHPIDVALQQLPDYSAPTDRLAVVWAEYTAATGNRLADPPSDEERVQVHEWLRSLRVGPNGSDYPLYGVKRPRPVLMAAETMVDKWSSLAHLPCNACTVIADANGGFGHTFPIQVEPWSAQSDRAINVQLKDRVTESLRRNWGSRVPTGKLAMCVTVTALLGKNSRKKDADNLLKGLLDSLSSLAWVDDSQIQCLASRRVEYSGDKGAYFVRYQAVEPWSADVVWDDPTPPRIVWGDPIPRV